MFKNFFIPNPANNYYPVGLRPRFMYTYLVFTLIFNLFAARYLTYIPMSVEAQTAYTGTDIIALTNQDRTADSLPTLKENTMLDNAAAAKAADMLKYQYWAHDNPYTGATPWDFIVQAGYNYKYAGENLAEGYPTADEVNTAWMNSQEHRDNILSPDYSDIGVAVVYGYLLGANTTLVVQMFGSLQNTVGITPLATPTPSSLPSATVTPTNAPILPTPKHNPGRIDTLTPTPPMTPSATVTPTPKPIQVNAFNTVPPTPSSTYVSATPNTLREATPTPSVQQVMQGIETKIAGMQFANKVNLLFGVFLLVIFLLDSIYYYNVRNIHKRTKPASISHIPVLVILILLCIIGTSGITL